MGLTHSPSIVTDGLVFCLDAANPKSYPGSGTTWTDMMGANNGTIDGATYNSGNGGCFIFDGSNDEVTFGSAGAALINGLAELTLEMWFKSDSINNDRGLIFGDSTSNLDDNGFSLRYDSAGYAGGGDDVMKTAFGTNDGGSPNLLESSSNIQSTDWMNISVTSDVGTSINLYKNGALDTPTHTLNGGSETTVSSCNNLVIGRGPMASNLWDGKISIVRIYNRILTAAEVLQNYNAFKGRYGL